MDLGMLLTFVINQNSKKRRTTKTKGNKGLRHFSKKVCDKVKQKKTTTYNEVADELVKEFNQGIDGRVDSVRRIEVFLTLKEKYTAAGLRCTKRVNGNENNRKGEERNTVARSSCYGRKRGVRSFANRYANSYCLMVFR